MKTNAANPDQNAALVKPVFQVHRDSKPAE